MALFYGSPKENLDRAFNYQDGHDLGFCSQVDFCEDQPILATIVKAIERTKWREPSSRLVVVIADWPDKSSADERAIRQDYFLDLAESKKTYKAGIRLAKVQALDDQLQTICGGVNASIAAPCLIGYAKGFSPLVMDLVERHLARIEPHIH
ncbi:hypothetical protein [uncultured Roseobacter sp.]|uniref:hypothetical protein n=1 Tax=uncultured Roseobacter sp. TaxID=114847 RepID=UPI002612EFA9|nr:hypothetical protein [uncultured Roseobacter sp.]